MQAEVLHLNGDPSNQCSLTQQYLSREQSSYTLELGTDSQI